MTATSQLRLPALLTPVPQTLVRVANWAGAWVRSNAIALATVLVSTAVYTFFSIHNHAAFGTNAYDLGIFGQGLKGYADGTGPISQIKGPGFSLLGDHFSPITALLTPAYLVFRSVVVLLVAQAFLIALGSAPLVTWARRELGAWQATAVGFLFATSFGVSSAIGFDFHEVAFAVPMLSFSLSALSQGRFRTATLWALPLVLVKEDLGVTVAAIGAVLLLRRQWKLGGGLVVFGLAATALEVKVLIPLANPDSGYGYANQMNGFGLSAIIHQSPDVTGVKIATLVSTLSVGLFLATRSTLLLVAVPTFAWRFVGGNFGYWTTGYQYSLVLMPIIVAAVVEVLVRHRAQGAAGTRFIRWALLTSIAVGALVALTFPLGSMLRASYWKANPRVQAMQSAVELVPQGATVASTNHLIPHLTDKATVNMLWGPVASTGRPRWIVADLQDPWPDAPAQRQANLDAALKAGYTELFSQDDIVVLKETSIR
jgi:uncharacterized membrane protein